MLSDNWTLLLEIISKKKKKKALFLLQSFCGALISMFRPDTVGFVLNLVFAWALLLFWKSLYFLFFFQLWLFTRFFCGENFGTLNVHRDSLSFHRGRHVPADYNVTAPRSKGGRTELDSSWFVSKRHDWAKDFTTRRWNFCKIKLKKQ